MRSSRVPGLVAVGGLAIALGIGGIVAPVAQAELARVGAAANNGMNRLAINPVLTESARGHADWMAVNNKVVGGDR